MIPAGARPDVGIRRGGKAGAGGGATTGAEGEAAAPVVAGGVPAARGVDVSGGVAAVQRDGSGHTSLRGHRDGVPGLKRVVARLPAGSWAHSLRRGSAQVLQKWGMELDGLQSALRHASGKQTRRYMMSTAEADRRKAREQALQGGWV